MKKEIYNKLIEKHKRNISDLQHSINMRREAADIDENETKEIDDLSQQDQNTEFVNALADQLGIAQQELEELTSYRTYSNDRIENGALVETKENYFIVGPSVSMASYEGKNIICISDQSTAYEENEGKTIKDKLVLADNAYEIIKIS